MQTDHEIFEKIKNSSDINPREDFVNNTRHLLINEAKRINKTRKIRKQSYYGSGVIATMAMIVWISFFGGNQYILSSYHHVMSSIPKSNEEIIVTSNKNPSVFIYHTHNRESFLPLLEIKEQNKAFDKNKNITLVGAELASELNKKNINVLHSDTDFEQILHNRNIQNYPKLYDIAREELQRVLKKNKNIKLILDIHRDSSLKNDTTITIDGKEVSRVSLVVSKNNPKFEENQRIANIFHQKLEDKYPGLSKGVFIKDQPFSKTTYNQDLFSNSLLLQIGGVENTLEEENRSVDLIAEIIDEILVDLD